MIAEPAWDLHIRRLFLQAVFIKLLLDVELAPHPPFSPGPGNPNLYHLLTLHPPLPNLTADPNRIV